MRRLQFAACLAAGFFLLMVGCTCAGETDESDPAAASAPGASGVGSGERPTPAAKLPSLRPPESDIRRSLELFQSSGAEPAALEIPPPPSDLAAAVLETEPNDQKEQATALGSGRFARGSGGDDNDYFSFEVDPPLRRWLLEVSGPTVERAEYFNAAGEKQRLGKVDGPEIAFAAANLVLAPGTHGVWVKAKNGGEYTVRIVPLGPASAADDREPNNDATRAMELALGAPRSGAIYPSGDRDFYRFSLFAEARIHLELDSPPDLISRLVLEDMTGQGAARVVSWTAAERGSSFSETRVFDAGDYLLQIAAQGPPSRQPYVVRLTLVEPGAEVVDLEPNNDDDSAGELPVDGIVTGTLMGSTDVFRLPPLAAETTVTLGGAQGDKVPRDVRFFLTADGRQSVRLTTDRETGVKSAQIPAGSPAVIQLHGNGGYRVELMFEPPLATAAAAAEPGPQIDARLSAANLRFAAFLERDQRTRLQASLANRGSRPVTLDLTIASSHYGWRPSLAATRVTLGPAESRVVEGSLAVAPDAWSTIPVDLSFEASAAGKNVASQRLRLFAECDAPPVDPGSGAGLAPGLEGGFNMAWSALGGRIGAADDRQERQRAAAVDGYTFINQSATFPIADGVAEATVELGGTQSVPVAGVLINSLSNRSAVEWIEDFELLLSEDGSTFTPALAGKLERLPIEQVFALPVPVAARFARLEIRSTHGAGAKWAALGELKVVAAPGFDASAGRGFNLAAPELGGHVVSWSWRGAYSTAGAMLTDAVERPYIRADPDLATEWVVGFHHNRAAQITRLEWVDSEIRYRRFERVQLAVSTDGPLGPWQPIGAWDLSGDPATPRVFELEQPTWARFVRFSSSEVKEAGTWRLPETVRIWERPVAAGYLSALGEWGHYAKRAAFEKEKTRPTDVPKAADDNDTRRTAEPLAPATPISGVVTLGDDVDWYRIEVPRDSNHLTIELANEPRLKTEARLFDGDGAELAWDRSTVVAGSARHEALVGPGRTLYLEIAEPPRAIAFAWDNSGSVGPYRSTIYQAMTRFSGEVEPGLEFANLHPFGGRLLLEDWSDDPGQLAYAVDNYDRKDSSSSAEPALILVSDELAERRGTRAAVFLTDAISPGSGETAELWSALERATPSVFTLHLHTASGVAGPHYQDIMQDWASAGGGGYEYFRTQGDLDAAFQRAACAIRRPARYELVAGLTSVEPPGPGYLSVDQPESAPGHAVELILDASGSMLQRLGGKRRIDIARDVLVSLVEQTIPAGTPVALRVFGHRKPDACDTELLVPLAPLERRRVSGAIRGTEAKNLAKTPIGDSLLEVPQDLASASGPKLVILLTDGEETCDGDPASAIRDLKEAGIDARLNVVGLAIDDEALKAEFESWARLGGGLYFDTADEGELGRALEAAMKPKFQVLDAAGEIVAEGTAGGDPIEVPMGVYQVKLLTSPARIIDEVRIEPEKTTHVGAEPSSPE